jgi:hypothetical protein
MDNRTSPSCADELSWQRLADGEVDADAAELMWHHLSVCDACRSCMAVVQANRRLVSELLGSEDDDPEAGAGAVTRVAEQLRGRTAAQQQPAADSASVPATVVKPAWTLAWWRRRSDTRSTWPRAAVATAALAAMALLVLWLPSAEVTATPDFVLSKAQVSARAWMYQPGKVLRWVIESEIKGHPSMPDGKYRSLWWRSNVEGKRAEILRNYDENNRLSYGRWLKADGRDVYFSSRGVAGKPNLLTIQPSDASLAAVLPSLPVVQQEPVRRYLRESASTPDFRSPLMADRLGEWLVDAAEGRKRNRTIERLTTPEWGTVYYVRGDWRREDNTPWRFGPGVTRFVDEQYIGLTDFRIYRRKTTRYNDRGEAAHVGDARYHGFSETTLAEFRSEDLDFDGPAPAGWTVVRQTPEELAALIARPLKAPATQTPGTKNKQ